MFAALIVGALTAWFLGLRLGIIAAVATAVALLVAMFVPGMSITIYALVLVWCGSLYFFGKKIAVMTNQKGMAGGTLGAATSAAGQAHSLINQASSWVKRTLGKQSGQSDPNTRKGNGK